MSKKESYWFSHDSDAANDPRMVALIDKYGLEGYGRWWRLLERLRACEAYRYDTGMPFAWAVLGKDLMLGAAEAEAFVHDCIHYFEVLQYDGQYLWSNNLVERMEYWEKKRESLRERGRKGGETRAKKKVKEEDEAQLEKNEAQLENSLAQPGKVMNILSTIEANETKRNQTKLNETTLYNSRVVTEPYYNDDIEEGKDKSDVMDNKEQQTGKQPQQELDILRDKALADDRRFVYAYVSTGRMNKTQLADWLTAFNISLRFTGVEIKEERDYRRHFAAWLRYRDVAKEDPRKYNPALTPTTAPAQALTVPLPVAQSVLRQQEPEPPQQDAEQPAEEQHKPFQLKLETDTRGKYSDKDNKYDMRWLRGLRDEVRKMGG